MKSRKLSEHNEKRETPPAVCPQCAGLTEREQAQNLLYRIAKAMAAVKDGRELLRIIVRETQPVFDFYDIGLAVLDKSGEFFVDWAVFYKEINPSAASVAQRANDSYKFSVDELLFKHAFARAERENKPFIENMTADFAEEFKDFPQLPLEIEYGYKQFLATTLKFGGETLGFLNFNGLRENHFEACDLELFQAIADLVAAAIANIQAHEEIAERATEKDVLLSISQAIAAIQDSEQLFKIIFERIQPIFGFHDVGLFVLSKNEQYLTDWAAAFEQISPSSGNLQTKESGIATFKFENSPPHAVARKLAEIDAPAIFNYAECFAERPPYDAEVWRKGAAIVEAGGYQDFLATRLKTGGKTLGFLYFNSLAKGFFKDAQLAMFQAVADQIATAVANILANQEILEQTREKALLLAVSEDIAAVRGKRDLLQTIIGKVKPLFGFYDCGIMILDKDRRRFHDWAVLMPDIDASPANDALAQIGFYSKGGIDYENSLLQHSIVELEQTGQPIFWDYQKDYEKGFSDGALLVELKKLGYQRGVAALLRTGGEVIGAFFINSLEPDFFRREQFGLLQGVADQIAVAVSNIVANEDILEREREKSVLLQISQVIATVRNKQDLLQLIVEKIKPVFNFHDCGIFVFDRDRQTLEDLTVSLPSVSPSETNDLLARNDAAKFRYRGSVWESIFETMRLTGKPLIFNYRTNQTAGWSDYVQSATIDEAGYAESLMTILTTGGEELGVFAVNSLENGRFGESQFGFFQNVANQMAVAVANILANEDILERTHEKSVLLSISEDIAGARNAVELLQVIRNKAQKLIPFYDTGILIVEPDGAHHYDLAVNLQGWDTSESNRKLHDAGLNRIVHPGSYVEYAMRLIEKSNSPVIEDYETRYSEFDYPFFAVMKDLGYKESIAAALKSSGKTFGTLWLNSLEKDHFNSAQFEIFQALADQVAVAVSNILANDEIKKQLVEITNLKKRLEAENKYLTEEVRRNYNFDEIIGTSPRLMQVFDVIETVAPTDATVLIQGETGTGKELAARAIHNRSSRNARPLIKINCAALPRELVESELFGHEKGSFTGAFEKRLGKFELADKGTIFLDEIGELPLEMQVKLLRVLQEREIERVGGKGTIKLDLRVVAATNRNLAQEVQAGRFRADLYYRLCTVELFMPSLRERREDIESLTLHFARKYAAKFSRNIELISSQMLTELNAYDFPGNIRELEHIVEHAVIFSKNEKLILPRSLNGNVETQIATNGESTKTASSTSDKQTLETVERAHIIEVLRQTSGRIKGNGGAAEILGLNPATVYFRIKKLGIEKTRL